jgi:hypothetical protein
VSALQSGIDWATMWNSTGTHVTSDAQRGALPQQRDVDLWSGHSGDAAAIESAVRDLDMTIGQLQSSIRRSAFPEPAMAYNCVAYTEQQFGERSTRNGISRCEREANVLDLRPTTSSRPVVEDRRRSVDDHRIADDGISVTAAADQHESVERRMQMGSVPERSAVNGTLSQMMRNEAQVVGDVDKSSKVTAAAGMSASRYRPVSRHSFVTVSDLQDFSDADSSWGVAVDPVLEDTYRSRTDADEVLDAVESHRRRAFAARGSCCNSLRVNDDGRRLSPARLIGDDVHLARHTEQQREDGHRVGGKMEPESTMGSGWRDGDRSARFQEDRGFPENRRWQRRPEFNGGDEDRRSLDNGRRIDGKKGNRSERKNMDSARVHHHERLAGAGGDPSSSGSDSDDGGSRRHRGHWKEDGHWRRYPPEKRRGTEPYPSFDSDDSEAEGRSRRTTDCRRWLKPEKFDG